MNPIIEKATCPHCYKELKPSLGIGLILTCSECKKSWTLKFERASDRNQGDTMQQFDPKRDTIIKPPKLPFDKDRSGGGSSGSGGVGGGV